MTTKKPSTAKKTVVKPKGLTPAEKKKAAAVTAEALKAFDSAVANGIVADVPTPTIKSTDVTEVTSSLKVNNSSFSGVFRSEAGKTLTSAMGSPTLKGATRVSITDAFPHLKK